jgi:preprotein translocase subunit SecA
MSRTNIPEDMPIESGILDKIIESSQERIEGYNFDMRKNVVEYDDVMSKQRQAVYNERREILMGKDDDLDEKVDVAFDQAIKELVDHYVNDYTGFIRGEVERVVGDFTTDATNTVNVPAIVIRLGSLLPLMAELDREELERSSPDKLITKLVGLAPQQEEQGTNLLQLLQAMGRFLPLIPPAPNLGVLATFKTGQMQTRERLRVEYVARVNSLYFDFLAEYIDRQSDRESIWTEAETKINRAFNQFSLDGLSIKNKDEQQRRFRTQVDEALRQLLLESLKALNADKLTTALEQYVDQQQAKWQEVIGHREYRNYKRQLLLAAIDREWRDYLTAMDDLRREIGLQAFGQRDPKVEYKKRSFEMFTEMHQNIDRYISEQFFVQIESHRQFVLDRQAQQEQIRRMEEAGYRRVKREHGKGQELRRELVKIGRNDPCFCGSGRKYKNCHGRPQAAVAAAGGNGQASQGQAGRPASKAGKKQQKKKARR